MHPESIVYAMQLLLTIAAALVASLPTGAFKSLTITRQTINSLQMALQMEMVKMPVQLNPRDYFYLLQKLMPDQNIIRWYIAKIEEDTATIEVVREFK